jgi:hypothetical protein
MAGNQSKTLGREIFVGLIVYAPHGRELEGESPLRKDHLLGDYTTGGNR